VVDIDKIIGNLPKQIMNNKYSNVATLEEVKPTI
jgi:hypothetical protein